MPNKIGPREQQLRDMRGESSAAAATRRVMVEAVDGPKRGPAAKPPRATAPAKPEESVMGAKTTKTTKKAKSKSKAKRPAARAAAKSPKKTAAPKAGGERSPLAVAEFICAGGAGGVAMADLEKKFGIEAHPMRSKIHAARHELGYAIEFDAKAKRYVGKPPSKAAA